MSYYSLLGLNKEPFSTSPDPDFFYDSSEHHTALIRLMIEIRLKRGLSLILGDVGVGKTTLLRKLLRMFAKRLDIRCAVIFDPTYESEKVFINDLIHHFKIDIDYAGTELIDCKKALKNFLFQKGVEEEKTTVLLIDEAQKLSLSSLEVLRSLLNYETNEYKLLQLVLLGQLEILPRLKQMVNFLDRISFKYLLPPLTEEETYGMINFRLKQAGYKGGSLFTREAIKEIWKITKGYPRRSTMLCHQALKELIMCNLDQIDRDLVQELFSKEAKIFNEISEKVQKSLPAGRQGLITPIK